MLPVLFGRYFTPNLWQDGWNRNLPIVKTILKDDLRESTLARVCINITSMRMIASGSWAGKCLPSGVSLCHLQREWECEWVTSFSDGRLSYYWKRSISQNPKKGKSCDCHRTAVNSNAGKKNLIRQEKLDLYELISLIAVNTINFIFEISLNM